MKISAAKAIEGLTWLYVEGTQADLVACQRWIDANRTMWVNSYKILVQTDSGWKEDNSGSIAWAMRQMKAKGFPNYTNVYQQKFCFKSASDAMRFKLSLT